MTHYQWYHGPSHQWWSVWGSSVDSSLSCSSPRRPHLPSSHHHYCSPVMAAASFVSAVSPAAASPRSRPGPSGRPGMPLHDTPPQWSHPALITSGVTALQSTHQPSPSPLSCWWLVAARSQESGGPLIMLTIYLVSIQQIK